MEFIRNVMATLVGLIFFFVMSTFILFAIIGTIAATADYQIEIKDKSVLLLDVSGEIREQVPDDPFWEMFDEEMTPLPLLNSVIAIREASNDDRIKGLIIKVGFFNGGFGTLKELRDAVIEFKSSGKFVYAYGEFMSEGGYYLASVADEVYLHPEGNVELNGLSTTVTFFKKGLEKLGIEPQIFRVGDFKSAIEPLIREDLSAENRLQLEEWLSSLNEQVTSEIAESRNIEQEALLEIENSMLAVTADDAKKHQLVNDLIYSDQIRALINQQLEQDEDEDFSLVNTNKYFKSWRMSSDQPNDEIAVIIAEGEIVNGEGSNYQVGSKKFASTIRRLRRNENVKAIVVRINSPGGGALASDVIWRELVLASENIPVIASMSDYATSGGYYLAMPCDEIIAQNTSLTGSIGVFGMIPNLGPFLDDKLGITNDVVRTGEFSDIYTVTRALRDEEKEIIQRAVNDTYESFVSKAAEGRGVNVDDIQGVAGGRIWSGTTAVDNGLVDRNGTFTDALELAAEQAGLEEYQFNYYPRQKTFFEEVVGNLGSQAFAAFKLEVNWSPYQEVITKLKDYQGIQARLPFDIEIH